MSDDISFNLFGEGGFINPTPWSYSNHGRERFETPFYDSYSGSFRQRQTSDFDGGWRWFDAYDIEALTIYNQKLDKRAYFHLTAIDMVSTRLTPECLLFWAKSMVLVDHRYYTFKNWLEDHIRALARKANIEIMKEIRGDGNFITHLHSVR